MKARGLGVEWIYGPDPKRPAGKVTETVVKVRSSRNLYLANPSTKVWFDDGRVERFRGAPGLPGPNGLVPEIPVGTKATILYNGKRWILKVDA